MMYSNKGIRAITIPWQCHYSASVGAWFQLDIIIGTEGYSSSGVNFFSFKYKFITISPKLSISLLNCANDMPLRFHSHLEYRHTPNWSDTLLTKNLWLMLNTSWFWMILDGVTLFGMTIISLCNIHLKMTYEKNKKQFFILASFLWVIPEFLPRHFTVFSHLNLNKPFWTTIQISIW